MPLGDGWSSLDRAVDAPALQDVPAWDGIVAWLTSGLNRNARWSLKLCYAGRICRSSKQRRGMWT